MIADTVESLGRYLGLHPALDRGLEALRRLAESPPEADGRQDLEGEALYASFSSYSAGEPAAKTFEAHRKYVDIQAVLAGRETLYWAPLERLRERTAYEEAGDIATLEDPPARSPAGALDLAPGVFVVLFPQDAHKPGCRVRGGPPGAPPGGPAGGERVRKLVLKVRI